MEMKLALDVVGGFKVEHRGLVEVKVMIIFYENIQKSIISGTIILYLILKGKGMMDTYWLCGKEGGVGRSVELDTPGFFEQGHMPAYMADLDDYEAWEQ